MRCESSMRCQSEKLDIIIPRQHCQFVFAFLNARAIDGTKKQVSIASKDRHAQLTLSTLTPSLGKCIIVDKTATLRTTSALSCSIR